MIQTLEDARRELQAILDVIEEQEKDERLDFVPDPQCITEAHLQGELIRLQVMVKRVVGQLIRGALERIGEE